MTYKGRKGGNAVDIKKEIDKPYEGVYLGFKGITTKIGEQKIYKFRMASGRLLEIYGFTMLNRVMENIITGEQCRITYLGTENVETKFGMKDVHQVKVEVDDEFQVNVEDIDDDPTTPF